MGRLGWQALLLIPLVLVLYGLARLLYRPDERWRVPLPRFVVASLLVHVGLLFALDLVLISIPVVEAHREWIDAVMQRTFATEPATEAAERRWSSVADGPAIAEPAFTVPAGEVAFAPELRGIAPTIPAARALELRPEQVLYVPPPEPNPHDSPASDLPRAVAMRGLELPPAEAPRVEPAPPIADPVPTPPAATVGRRRDELPISEAARDGDRRIASRIPDASPPPRIEAPITPLGTLERPRLDDARKDRGPRAVELDPLPPIELARAFSADLGPPAAPARERTPGPAPTRFDLDAAKPPSPDLSTSRVTPFRPSPRAAEPVPTPTIVPPNRIERRPMMAELPVAPRDDVDLTVSLSLRSPEVRKDVVAAMGGNAASEGAVGLGLGWLVAHQGPEGNWSLHDLHCRGHACGQAGAVKSDTAATGLALMALLGAGHTPRRGSHATVVARGVRWLIAHQSPDGDLTARGESQMYAHALATIALCEAFGLSRDEDLRTPATRALGFIVAAQDPKTGGWRYRPREGGDTSVVGWQLMALKSGEMAGLSVPAATYRDASRWLDAVRVKSDHSRYGYKPGRAATPAMTAEALLCRQYLGLARDDPAMRSGSEYLRANLPAWTSRNSYYWYYGTQVMFHLQGESWAAWNGKLRDPLVAAQVKDGPAAGSWHPLKPSADQWGDRGGRLYETALSLLMLEVYYRHLPLYQQLGPATQGR